MRAVLGTICGTADFAERSVARDTKERRPGLMDNCLGGFEYVDNEAITYVPSRVLFWVTKRKEGANQ